MKQHINRDVRLFARIKTLITASITFFSLITGSFAGADTSPSTQNFQPTNALSKFRSANPGQAINNQYIVVLKDQYVNQQMSTLMQQGAANAADVTSYRKSVVTAVASETSTLHNAQIKYRYHSVLSGFSATMTPENMRALLADERVAFIEQDQVVHATAIQYNPTWGLDRIDQADLPLDSQFNYAADGTDVNAYIIDTGVMISHSDFAARATHGYDFIDNDAIAQDCSGHGTHVAGTIGSATYGVAKNVTLIGVRVLDCNGRGTNASVIAGVDWVAQHAIHPAVANMSLGGEASAALDDAVQNAIDSGVTFVVAAGNHGDDACYYSPARVSQALTVASSTAADARSEFSNWGSCVDVFAPGSLITSTWSNGDTATISGTSMAAPHVAGAVALYLQNNADATPAMVNAAISTSAVSGKISDSNGSPNLLLQTQWHDTPTPAVLKKGVPVTGLSGSAGSEVFYTLTVPAQASNLSFTISGGSGNASLYVQYGAAPTPLSYDCRAQLTGNTERCDIASPQAGTYYVLLRGDESYSGVILVGDYTASGDNDAYFENTTDVPVPDNDASGALSTIDVSRAGLASIIIVDVAIKHTYTGDLVVALFAPNGDSVILHNRSAGFANDLVKSYRINAPTIVARGTWQLRVRDMAWRDVGYIDHWSITFADDSN